MKLLIITFALMAQIGYAASYAVPVPSELASHANWDLKLGAANASVTGDTIQATYLLPDELDGLGSRFHFSGKLAGPFAEVSGAGVYGVCMLAGDTRLSCMLQYPELVIDVKAADAALAKKFSGEALLARSQVVRLFGNDPAGILFVDVAK